MAPGDMPELYLMPAWNYAEEILRRETACLEAGGGFIIPELAVAGLGTDRPGMARAVSGLAEVRA